MPLAVMMLAMARPSLSHLRFGRRHSHGHVWSSQWKENLNLPRSLCQCLQPTSSHCLHVSQFC